MSEFLAVLYADGGEAEALSLVERHDPMTIARLGMAAGGLLLCRWDRRPVPATGLVAVLDGSGGAPEVPTPRNLVDAAQAPSGLLAAACQYRSYLWLDGDGSLTAWTDHLGLSRLYHGRAGNCLLLSDDPVLLAGADPEPDPAGVCSFLVNGHMVRERTLFAGVSSLPAASIVALSPSSVASSPYWRHRPGAEAWTDRRAIENELWRRITAATLAATDDRHAVIALSGGYDSTAILGILHAAGRPVSTFSFAFGEPRPWSDADVGRRRAAMLGVEHRIYRFDEGFDIAGMLGAHAADGLVMRKPCYEIGAFEQVLGDLAARGRGAVVLFGDEAFGQGAYRIRDDRELLGSAALKSPALLSRLAPHLTAECAARLGEALWSDYEAILARPRLGRVEDTKDMLFLDSYLRANMIEMRHQTMGRRQAIALPLLELGVMDMARHTPHSLRTQKRMFESLVRKRLPAIFRVPQARHSQGQPSIGIEMRRQHRQLALAVGQLRRGIPGAMSPAALAAALDALCATPVPSAPAPMRLATTVARMFVKRELAPPGLVDLVRRRYWNKFEVADQAMMLMRALQLAMTFDRCRGAPARLSPAASPST